MSRASRGVSDEDGHGTAVTATAAGARNDAQNLGVAFDATILSFRADTPGSCADDRRGRGCTLRRQRHCRGDRCRAGGRRQGHQHVARRRSRRVDPAQRDRPRGQRRDRDRHLGGQRRRGCGQGRQCRSLRAERGAGQSRARSSSPARSTPISPTLAAFSNRAGDGPATLSLRARPQRAHRSTIPAPASSIRGPASPRRSSAARWR